MNLRVAAAMLVLPGLAALPALAQAVISTQAGLINYTEGTVLLNDRAFTPRAGQFQQMREQDTLRTANVGRAEVLLSPGVFLRVGHDSAFRLDSSRITDAKVEMLGGTAVVEAAELGKGNRLTFTHGGTVVSLTKNGLYRFEANPATLRVLSGKAVVQVGGKAYDVKAGRMVALDGGSAVAKFDRKREDTLDVWSQRRSARLAQANLAGTYSIRQERGLPRSSFWLWNSLLGTFTYIPAGMYYTSPYGFYFWRDYYARQTMTQPSYSGSGGGGVASGGSGSPGGGSSSSGPGSFAGNTAASGGGGVGGNYGGGGGGGGAPSGGGSPAANPK